MSPRPTIWERIQDVVELARDRPLPIILALVIGVVGGLLIRGATSGDESTAGRPARSAAPVANHESKPKPEPEHMPPASGARRSESSAGGVSAALAAVDDYASRNGADVGVSIVPLDGSLSVQQAGTVEAGHPWSTMKVPTAAAYLDFKRKSEGTASGEETIPDGSTPREELGEALVSSVNIAIRHRVQEMIDALGNQGAAEQINVMLGQGGAQPQISPQIDPSIDSLQIGTGEWTLAEAAIWFRDLQVGSGQCLGLAQADRVFILRQLHAAPETLHWGAAVALAGEEDQIALKPGWGSDGDDFTVEQAVIVGSDPDEAAGFPSLEGGYVMVLMTKLPSSDPSAFTEGQQQLAELAELVAEKMGRPGPEADAGLAGASVC